MSNETSVRDRVELERSELFERFERLNAFLSDDRAKALPVAHVRLLLIQKGAMMAYVAVLEARLALLEEARALA